MNHAKYISITFLLLAGLLFFAGCSDHDMPDTPVAPGQLVADVTEIRLPVRAAYHAVAVTGTNKNPSGVKVSADQSWIELMADTVSSDGYVEIHVERNEATGGRRGTLTIGDMADGGVEIPVYQCGLSDDDNNSGQNCYAGCGYNIFNELNSESSICSAVIDFDAATAIDPMIVQTAARNVQDVKTITSNSLAEMSQLMTHSVEKTKTGLKGNKKTILRFENKSGSTKMDETGYAYINLQRIAACSSLDISKVMQYVGQGKTDILTPEFKKQYDSIIAAPTAKKVFELFQKFGTHIVSYVDLGGTMDIAVSFNKTMVGELNMRADDFRKYFFNSEPSDYTLNNQIQGLSTSVSNAGTFKVAGGTEDTRKAIIKDCEKQGHINPDHIYSWAQTLPKRDFMSQLDLLAPINVQLVPIWSIFPQNLANLFFECAIQESQKSTNSIDDAKVGLDNYGIRIEGADFMNFKDSPKESLVRVVYANQSKIDNATPILEICNEYVPQLKVSERITVIYPIKNGQPFHGTGLYPGDGEGCGPAWLTFSEGDVYVLPIEGTNSSTKLDSVYYLHGNIYLTSLGLDLKRSIAMAWKPKGIIYLPIVKIGSGYWTRRNVDTSIKTGVYAGSSFRERESWLDGMIWVPVKCETHRTEAPAGIGKTLDEIYGRPKMWYFPTNADRDNLTEYIGYETRHLLKGQLTGFDAQYEGFYGPGGIDGVTVTSKIERHNRDKCYLIFKTAVNSDIGSALTLDSNYRWNTVAIGAGNNNYFPLRLFRTSYYRYDNYKNAKDNYISFL